MGYRRVYKRNRTVFLIDEHSELGAAEDDRFRAALYEIFDCGFEFSARLWQKNSLRKLFVKCVVNIVSVFSFREQYV